VRRTLAWSRELMTQRGRGSDAAVPLGSWGTSPVGAGPGAVTITPDGETLFVVNFSGDSVSTIDLNTRTKNPTDIPVGSAPFSVAITPCRR